MRTMRGVVTIVQEGRFQLVDEAGVSHLFLLGHAAAAEPSQLPVLRGHTASVRYTSAPNIIGMVAHRIALED